MNLSLINFIFINWFKLKECSSSGPSSGDDENEDMDEIQNLAGIQQSINVYQNNNFTKKSKVIKKKINLEINLK